MKILFIMPTYIGDMIMTTGVLAWLIEQYPEARFTIACGPKGLDLFSHVPRLDKIHIIEKKKWHLHWVALWTVCWKTRWELVVDFRHSISFLLLAKKRAVKKKQPGIHKVIENALILNIMPPPAPKLWIDPQMMRKVKSNISFDKPRVVIAPAANWSLKQWPLEYFIELVSLLICKGGLFEGACFQVLGAEHEAKYLEPLIQALSKMQCQCINLVGVSLQETAAYLHYASIFVGNDSGLMHLAAAVGTPTVGLFGPGYPDIYRPWGSHAIYVQSPIQDAAFSMSALSVKQVMGAIEHHIRSICEKSEG